MSYIVRKLTTKYISLADKLASQLMHSLQRELTKDELEKCAEKAMKKTVEQGSGITRRSLQELIKKEVKKRKLQEIERRRKSELKELLRFLENENKPFAKRQEIIRDAEALQHAELLRYYEVKNFVVKKGK